jgi:hypothetical protein
VVKTVPDREELFVVKVFCGSFLRLVDGGKFTGKYLHKVSASEFLKSRIKS